MSKTWREKLAPIVGEVIHEHQGEDLKDIRRACRVKFAELRIPYARQGTGHIYSIWLSEIRIQLGLEPTPQQKRAETSRTQLIEAGQQEMDL